MAARFSVDYEAFLQQVRDWEQSLRAADANGLPAPSTPVPVVDKNVLSSYHGASRIYNAMVAPLVPYGIRGFLWYQGETNAVHPAFYDVWFPALIREWRREWGQGNIPFLYVQLPNYSKAGGNVPDSWAIIRETQLKALAEPATAMAIAIDIGESENIHPQNKQEVGRRLALAALANVYGKEAAWSGPIYESMAIEGSSIRLRFRHAEGGLRAKGGDGALSTDAPLSTFMIAGADRQFVPAQAKIDGDTVVVSAEQVKEPIAVRYAWSNDPVGCNLYNGANLPASPFRTDSWPVIPENAQ